MFFFSDLHESSIVLMALIYVVPVKWTIIAMTKKSMHNGNIPKIYIQLQHLFYLNAPHNPVLKMFIIYIIKIKMTKWISSYKLRRRKIYIPINVKKLLKTVNPIDI